MIRKLFIPTVFLFFCCASCSTEEQEPVVFKNETLENYILEKVSALEEVAAYQPVFPDSAGQKIRLESVIRLRPRSDEMFYWIESGYFIDDAYYSCHNFYFYPADSSLKYFDVVTDRILSIDNWRKEKEQVAPVLLKEQHTSY